MDKSIITQPVAAVNPATFHLAIFSETVENDTEPDFTQNPAAPAERGTCEHPGDCLADLPHRSMTLAERVELMRGPVEEGID